MVNALQRKHKKIKLKDIYIKYAVEKNMYRGLLFFNFKKFRRRKWKFHRSKFLYQPKFVFHRFAPNITYIPRYNHLIQSQGRIEKIKINEFGQLLTYRSRLALRRKISGFFFVRRYKDLRRMFVFRHMTTHFNVFDSNYELMLVRLGIADTIKEARDFILCGVLKVNGRVQFKTKHFNNFDIVQFSRNLLMPFRIQSYFSKKLGKWASIDEELLLTAFNYFCYLILENHEKSFTGILPFTFPVNYSTFTFIFFNILMKNQWHFVFDFHIVKKFFHYNR